MVQAKGGKNNSIKLSQSLYSNGNSEKKPNENINNLTQLLIYKDWFETFATCHGIATEPHAKNELITFLKEKGHKIISTRECGTVASKEYPFLSASPDLIIECQCCGVTLVDIRCPY